MAEPWAALGTPDPTGTVPLVFAAPSEGPEGAAVAFFVGGFRHGACTDADDALLGADEFARTRARLLAEPGAWTEPPLPLAVAVARRAIRGALPEPLEHLLLLLPAAQRAAIAAAHDPWSRLPSTPDPRALQDIDALSGGDPSRPGLGVLLAPDTVYDGAVAVDAALRAPGQAAGDRRAAISGALDALATRWWATEDHATWAFACEALALVGHHRKDERLLRAAWSTSLAIRAGTPGAALPIVRAEVERNVAHALSEARRSRGPRAEG
jgi:hypothetical protein